MAEGKGSGEVAERECALRDRFEGKDVEMGLEMSFEVDG